MAGRYVTHSRIRGAGVRSRASHAVTWTTENAGREARIVVVHQISAALEGWAARMGTAIAQTAAASGARAELLAPVFQLQPLDASKLTSVGGDEDEVSRKGLPGQQHVVRADRRTRSLQGRSYLS